MSLRTHSETQIREKINKKGNYQKFTMPFETKKNENGTATPCKLLKGAAHGKMS